MMEKGNENVGCGRKRGRDETQTQTHEDCKAEQQKKFRDDCFYSCLLALESPDSEEDLACDIDEEHVYNLMKELMEEIGMEANPQPRETSVPLPLACLGDTTTYSSCNLAASSSTNCPSKVADSMKMEPAKSVIKKRDYYVREDFAEATSKRGVLV